MHRKHSKCFHSPTPPFLPPSHFCQCPHHYKFLPCSCLAIVLWTIQFNQSLLCIHRNETFQNILTLVWGRIIPSLKRGSGGPGYPWTWGSWPWTLKLPGKISHCMEIIATCYYTRSDFSFLTAIVLWQAGVYWKHSFLRLKNLFFGGGPWPVKHHYIILHFCIILACLYNPSFL